MSTNLCTAHRQQVIKDIKKWQAKTDKKQEDRLVCVSTQLIEAGVDLSFSCVIRSMAGLPSVTMQPQWRVDMPECISHQLQ